MANQSLRPSPIPRPLEAVDALMRPVMYGLGGFRADSVQETHPWHIQDIDPELVDSELSVLVKGNAAENMRSHNLFLFHAPILGGWTHYTLLRAAEMEFHVGWISRVRGKLAQAAVHRLPLTDGAVRMLNGPAESETHFFAVNTTGDQIAIENAGEGELGDNQFPGTRLL